MTPDDMEGRLAYLLSLVGDGPALWSHGSRQSTSVSYADLRALLLDYQERGRALHFYADEHEYPSDGPWGVNSDDFGKVARATLKGKSHD
jgi:hypothetical protein